MAVVDEAKLMHVARRGRPSGLNWLDYLIALVHNDALASGIALVLVAPKEAKVIGSVILAKVRRMSGDGTEVGDPGPDETLRAAVSI